MTAWNVAFPWPMGLWPRKKPRLREPVYCSECRWYKNLVDDPGSDPQNSWLDAEGLVHHTFYEAGVVSSPTHVCLYPANSRVFRDTGDSVRRPTHKISSIIHRSCHIVNSDNDCRFFEMLGSDEVMDEARPRG